MKKLTSTLAFVWGVLSCVSALVATPQPASTDYINAGFGDYDFDKNGSRSSVDYRLEYQWGLSALPAIDRDWAGVDTYFQLHPVAGFEGTGDGMSYFHGGFDMDVPVVDRLMLTWGESLGWYNHGDSAQSLGSPFEIRSQIEVGWRFENDLRLSGYVSHMSNAGVGDHDPGAETIGGYLRLPVSLLAR